MANDKVSATRGIGDQARRAQAAAERAARTVGDSVGNATQQAVDGLRAAWQKFGW